MRRLLAAVALTLACASIEAALPLALLGKEIVKSIVQSLVEDLVHASLLAALGPCDGALASAALTNLQALAGSRGIGGLPGGIAGLPGGIPGVPPGMASAMPLVPGGGMPPGLSAGMGAAGAVGMAAGSAALASGLGGLPIGNLSALGVSDKPGDLPPQVRQMVREAAEEDLRERRAEQKRRGLTPEQMEAEDRQMAKEQQEDAEQLMAMLRETKPLTVAELDEFVTRYEKIAQLAPEAAPCSPESLRRVLTPALALPMTAGPIRMMLRSFRELDAEMGKAKETFAAMSAEDRADFARQMDEQIEDWSDTDRQAFQSLLKANALGMPEPLRDEMLNRLR